MSIPHFRSRAQLLLRKPRNISTNVYPLKGGLAVHYGGDGSAPENHEDCEKRWRSWQNFHMDIRGWADIAYNFGFCNHGYVLAGRGYGVRSAAQGTNDGNDRFLAACWVGGANSTPSPNAYNALQELIVEVRELGAGLEVKPHIYFHSTACPGKQLKLFTLGVDGRPTKIIPPAPTKQPVKEQPKPTTPVKEVEEMQVPFIVNVKGPDLRAYLILGNGKRWIREPDQLKNLKDSGIKDYGEIWSNETLDLFPDLDKEFKVIKDSIDALSNQLNSLSRTVESIYDSLEEDGI